MSFFCISIKIYWRMMNSFFFIWNGIWNNWSIVWILYFRLFISKYYLFISKISRVWKDACFYHDDSFYDINALWTDAILKFIFLRGYLRILLVFWRQHSVHYIKLGIYCKIEFYLFTLLLSFWVKNTLIAFEFRKCMLIFVANLRENCATKCKTDCGEPEGLNIFKR